MLVGCHNKWNPTNLTQRFSQSLCWRFYRALKQDNPTSPKFSHIASWSSRLRFVSLVEFPNLLGCTSCSALVQVLPLLALVLALATPGPLLKQLLPAPCTQSILRKHVRPHNRGPMLWMALRSSKPTEVKLRAWRGWSDHNGIPSSSVPSLKSIPRRNKTNTLHREPA